MDHIQGISFMKSTKKAAWLPAPCCTCHCKVKGGTLSSVGALQSEACRTGWLGVQVPAVTMNSFLCAVQVMSTQYTWQPQKWVLLNLFGGMNECWVGTIWSEPYKCNQVAKSKTELLHLLLFTYWIS